jgi:hypothetical protein
MAAISSNATPPQNGGKTQFEILEKPSAEEQMTAVNLVSPGYFAILRIHSHQPDVGATVLPQR